MLDLMLKLCSVNASYAQAAQTGLNHGSDGAARGVRVAPRVLECLCRLDGIWRSKLLSRHTESTGCIVSCP
jgi:hypothetical protein